MIEKYDNTSLLNEARILFPVLTDISISNHPFNVSQEKKDIVPVVIYSSIKQLNREDTQKLEQWIKIRIKKNTVEVFWKSTSN
jgi:DNA phosphorothioation-dependent restriction protein DptG